MKKFTRLIIPFLMTTIFWAGFFALTPQASAMTCAVPGDYATIQTAVNTFACDVINVAAGTFHENVAITRDVTIHGLGPGATTVNGGAAGSVFDISAAIVVTITDMTITNGAGPFGGGVKVVDSTVILDNVQILRNVANQSGGGIYNFNGYVTVLNGEIVSNDAEIVNGGGIYQAFTGAALHISNTLISENGSPNDGGGIYNSGGQVTIQNAHIQDNITQRYGGGVENSAGHLTVENSQIVSNTALIRGGGIDNTGLLTVTNSAISYNQAISPTIPNPIGNGGGVSNFLPGTAVFEHVTIAHNHTALSGGGIWNDSQLTIQRTAVDDNSASSGFGTGGGIINSTGAVLEIIESTISRNTVIASGGGIQNAGTLTMTNSTVSGNHANGGGGLYNQNVAFIQFSTLSENGALAGGNLNGAAGTISMTHTIIADFDGGANCFWAAATIVSLDYNIASDASCPLSQANDLPNTDALLGPLQDNDGPTETHALLSGSPAIDSSDNTVCPATDQRGYGRPFGPTCDRGAYEYGFYIYLPVVVR
ncbi:MAG: hypothetical protein KJ069_17605 [Anaerolineae bacterium]|nr:hypothetical protein [Anaerolineae bacterium]